MVVVGNLVLVIGTALGSQYLVNVEAAKVERNMMGIMSEMETTSLLNHQLVLNTTSLLELKVELHSMELAMARATNEARTGVDQIVAITASLLQQSGK